MSDGIEFNPNIFLPRVFFKTLKDLEDKIKADQDTIESIILELCMYAATNLKDIVPEDWKEDSVMFVKNKIKELTEDLLDIHSNLVFYELFKSHLKNTGKDIIEYYPYKNLDYE